MPNLTTYPTLEQLEELNTKTPAYMVPNKIPYAAIGEGWLTDEQCDAILDKYMSLESYSFNHCNAMTRECGRPLDQVLDPMQNFARKMNDLFWKYDLRGADAWLQTYEPPNDYQKHMDVVPGQNRKLSAVLMLTESNDYMGGDLGIYTWPDKFYVPRTRGTVVVFQSWLVHFVSPVFVGIRQTINMGFWGPNFR